MTTTDARGRFLWHELLTTGPQGAQTFYPAVAGWATQPWEGRRYYLGSRRGEAARWPGAQWPDGGPRRRLGPARHGSLGRRLCAACRAETGVTGG
jgi:hypothetical protein